MQTAMEAQVHGTHGRRRLLRHYLEMVAAMVVGMLVLGAAVRGVLAIAGTELPAEYEELPALEMAVEMAAAMVIWMRFRGHGWPSTLEMAGAMIAPVIALMPLVWLGVIDGEMLLILEHVVMLPLMYVVMLRRRAEYEGAHHG